MESVFQKTLEMFREEEILANKILAEAQWNIPLLKSVANDIPNLSEDIIKHLPQIFNTKHILTPEIITEKITNLPRLTGFHLDRYGLLEKGKVIKFRRFETLENGFYRITPECNGIFKKSLSTLFPQDWTLEKVAEKVMESFANPEKVSVSKGAMTVKGKISEGFTLKTICENKKILTTYIDL